MGREKMQLDEGYAFGLGCFETILVKEKGVFLEEHISRLNCGLKKLDINKEIEISDVEERIRMNQDGDEFAFKIMVSEKNTVYQKRKILYTPKHYTKGFRVGQADIRRNEESPFTYIKSLCYGENILQKRKAVRNGFDEVIFFNSKGEITEGSVSNVFFIFGNEVVTPTVECGLLDGIVRGKVIEILGKAVVQRRIKKEEVLDRCTGAFLTNSLMGIMWVNELFGKVLSNGDVIEKIKSEYDNMVVKSWRD